MNQHPNANPRNAEIRRLSFWTLAALVALLVLVGTFAIDTRDAGGRAVAEQAQPASPGALAVRQALERQPPAREPDTRAAGMECGTAWADPDDCVYF